MRYLVIILIGLCSVFVTQTAWSDDCPIGEILVLTNPRPGTKTLHDSVTIRGFLCENFPYVVVKNETTNRTTLANTSQDCTGDSCTYHFVAPVRNLAAGSNQITTSIPGEDPPIVIEVEVIRTALAMLEM